MIHITITHTHHSQNMTTTHIIILDIYTFHITVKTDPTFLAVITVHTMHQDIITHITAHCI